LFGGQTGSRILSHVQGPVRHKTESSARFVELQAADAEVGQNAVKRTRLNMTADGTERLADKLGIRRSIAEFGCDLIEAGFGKLQCLGIAIKADQLSLWPEAADDLCRMPCQAECAVCNDASSAYIEKLNRIL
jgi:hypothetical protein